MGSFFFFLLCAAAITAGTARDRSSCSAVRRRGAVGGVADPAEKIRRLRAHIALLESGSTDTSREVMRQKKAKDPQCPVPRSREHEVHTVGQSRKS